jgi:(S)-ureidoglycine aminohydrolase
MSIVAAPESPTGTRIIHSREARRPTYFLMTPENHFPGGLPHLPDVVVRRLVTPRCGTAQFGQYRLDLAPRASATRPLAGGFEYFIYVLSGGLDVSLDGDPVTLEADGYAFAPDGCQLWLGAADGGDEARALLIKRRYERCDDVPPPAAVTGHRDSALCLPTSVAGVERYELLPIDDPSYDFNMSLLGFAPGTCFSRVELHDEEHGLYMTRGQGIYHLDGERHEVARDDFIYMAPYCPQSFYALGPGYTEYLLYKNVWRDGFWTGQ